MNKQIQYAKFNRAGNIFVRQIDEFSAEFLQYIDNCIFPYTPKEDELKNIELLDRKTLDELATTEGKKKIKFELAGKNDILNSIRRLKLSLSKNVEWVEARNRIFRSLKTYELDEVTLEGFFILIAENAPAVYNNSTKIKESYEKYIRELDAIKQSKNANISTEAAESFGRIGQAKNFIKIQPLYYDENKTWWAYNEESASWSKVDEVDLLNSIRHALNIDTVDSKSKSEIITALQQVARENKPDKLSKEWIQFNKTLVNPKTNERKEASAKYFITNPIPHELSESQDTPNIDRLFEEWVGKDYSRTLYQILAYTLTTDKFMQRLFAFTGGGSNGKGTCEKLLIKVVGSDNVGSSDLLSIATDKHATSYIHKKLLVLLGEASYSDLKNTNLLKKMSGEDKLAFNFKGKTGFTDDVTFSMILGTNALPETPDQSSGFYRRWLILDFPNQFTGIKNDVLDCLDEEEISNLCTKCVHILSELYQTRTFANEGTFDERRERYESRSRPLDKFLAECCEETSGEYTPQRTFATVFNVWLKKNNLRQLTVAQVGGMLRQHGYQVSIRKINDVSVQCIINVKITSETSKTSDFSNSFLRKETNLKNASFTSSASNLAQRIIKVDEKSNVLTDFIQSLRNSEPFSKSVAVDVAKHFNLNLDFDASLNKGNSAFSMGAHGYSLTNPSELVLTMDAND